MINKLSDIVLGRMYSFYLVKERSRLRRAVVHALINENEAYPDVNKTEAYVTIYHARKRTSINLLFASEFGIGESRAEAFSNYGRFKYEDAPAFDTSFDRVLKRSNVNHLRIIKS